MADIHFVLSFYTFCLVSDFGQVTDRQTEYHAYDPNVHMHRWAKKVTQGFIIFFYFFFIFSMSSFVGMMNYTCIMCLGTQKLAIAWI